MASPTVVPDIKRLREMNFSSLDVLTRALQRLKELRPAAAANPTLQDFIESEIDTVELEMRIGMIVQTRLQAANITVKPLSEANAARLQTLAAAIDQAIQNDAIVSATLGTVTSLITTATDLRDMVKSSTA